MVEGLQEEESLPFVPREAVEDEAEVPVVLVESGAHDLSHDFVRYQLAGIDVAPDVGSELRVALYVPAEDVADADVDEVESVTQALRLRPLAAALRTHDHELAHALGSFPADLRRV